MISRHSYLKDYESDEDEEIERIRRSSASELVELWKHEYDSANRELGKIRSDFYDLRGRHSATINECTEKDLEIQKLKQQIKNLDNELAKEQNQTDYWFRRSSSLENNAVEQKRRSTEMLKTQHELDESITNKYKTKTRGLEKRVDDLELENQRLSSQNLRLNALMKSLLNGDDDDDDDDQDEDFDAVRESKSSSKSSRKRKSKTKRRSHYDCYTQSSLARQRDPIYKTKTLIKKKSESLGKLLNEIEQDVRNHNYRNFQDGNKIMNKTKNARRQQRILNACV